MSLKNCCFGYIDRNAPQEFVVFLLGSVGDAGEVCGPSIVNVNVKDYVFACSCVVQGYGRFPMYVEGYREFSFSRLFLMLVRRAVVIVRRR
jgi:hypothetical protein